MTAATENDQMVANIERKTNENDGSKSPQDSVTTLSNEESSSNSVEISLSDEHDGSGENHNGDPSQEWGEHKAASIPPSKLRQKCTVKRILCILVTIGGVIVAIYALAVGFGGGGDSEGSGGGPLNWIPEFFFPDEDPYDGQTYTWDTIYHDDGGLSLLILNSLEEKWHPFFEQALTEWENGDPDALTLRKRRVAIDPDCKGNKGVMKVCNNDYGDTGWKGQNESLLLEGVIVSSVSKMNDYYHYESTDADKQYTMCHEFGHGFGLPHTDERFWNRDLGNCMDYTNRPENNMSPGRVNFEKLAEMYHIDATRRHLENTFLSVPQDLEKISNALKRFELEVSKISLKGVEDDHLKPSNYRSLRKFGRTFHHEAHHITIDLGEGFTGVVQMLLA